MSTKRLELERANCMRRILEIDCEISSQTEIDMKVLNKRINLNVEVIQALTRRLDSFFTNDTEPNLISIMRTLNQLRKDLDDHVHQS